MYAKNVQKNKKKTFHKIYFLDFIDFHAFKIFDVLICAEEP